MKEIKYRGWDKKDKKMRAVNSIAFHYEGESFDYDSSRLAKVVNMWGKDIIEDKSVIVHRDIEHVELMQFTGLHDKNGKEIYEGDIYKYSEDEIDVFESIEDFYYNELIQYRVEEGEIIGNIYENPELKK